MQRSEIQRIFWISNAKKCKNFLSILRRLANAEAEHVTINIQNLIQGLIDAMLTPEDFTKRLEFELNAHAKPSLIRFLKKSLPYLRYSLMIREMTMEGLRSPPPGTVRLPVGNQTT